MKIKMNGLTSVKELAIDHELTVHAIKLGVKCSRVLYVDLD